MRVKQESFTRRLLPAALAGFLLALTGLAQAATFQVGDVFAAVGGGQIQHWRPGTGLLDTYNTTRGGFTTGMAFDSAGNLYVTNFSDGSVSRFDTSGNLIDAQFVTSQIGNTSPESIVFDASGNFYVGHADGLRDVEKFDAAGNFLATYNVATEDRGSDWIDLAADQTTLIYTSEGYNVFAYDLETGTQLANFGVLANRPAFALRLLADGGLLVADSVNIKRLDSAGNTIQIYDAGTDNTFFALNLDPDGTSFWSGGYGNGVFYQFDIATGAILDSYSTGSSQFFGLTVYGEITQGGGGTEVPEPGTLSLLGLGLLGMGFMRRRIRKQA